MTMRKTSPLYIGDRAVGSVFRVLQERASLRAVNPATCGFLLGRAAIPFSMEPGRLRLGNGSEMLQSRTRLVSQATNNQFAPSSYHSRTRSDAPLVPCRRPGL